MTLHPEVPMNAITILLEIACLGYVFWSLFYSNIRPRKEPDEMDDMIKRGPLAVLAKAHTHIWTDKSLDDTIRLDTCELIYKLIKKHLPLMKATGKEENAHKIRSKLRIRRRA